MGKDRKKVIDMSRCTKTRNLEVHRIRRDGGNDLSNAKVLCQPCHEKTATFGAPGKTPPPFDEETNQRALRRAGNQCECTSTQGCH